ncbi:aldose 1-epimerase family protein [Polaribacter pectinis]|uniref:Aldose 1-epimerase family protein n=1 Tax=Polaribacter pectinis TaxID=2738844 RepID=A0A7G9L870_9FLAO|nr:aldose 1-epimerase family protein [Polaribacter pectinis]QNM84819.1 aldose 1-epimerase family protein [Polaribacter pectinis]
MKKYALVFLCFIVFSSCKNSEKTKEIIVSKIEKKEIYTISNDSITVSVKSFGAELTSIKKASKEYLWQGNPEFWKHQSPILFPIVGRLVDHDYNFKNKNYKMNFHGFAWKSEFNLIKKTQKSLTFELLPSENSRKQYPFEFKLQIEYVINGNILDVNYFVENPAENEDLYFSIGGHPAFNIPLKNGQQRDEYQLVFDNDSTPTSRDKESGLFVDTYTQFFEKPGILQIKDSTFIEGALVFNPNPFSKATLVHKPTKEEFFTIHFKDFPYVGIWSQKDPKTPFIAIEPWYGVADNIHHNKEFTLKEGIQILKPKKEFHSSFSVEVY